MAYEPGKDEADPLDFLSRHPLPETGHDITKKIIRWNVNAEHAVVVTRIREETQKDEIMQRLTKRIAKGDWEKHKTLNTTYCTYSAISRAIFAQILTQFRQI